MQNYAGLVELRGLTHCEAGRRIEIEYGEVLHRNGTLNNMYRCKPNRVMQAADKMNCANQTAVYICRGDKVEPAWAASFHYAGYRYAQITGWPTEAPVPDSDNFVAHFIHSAAPQRMARPALLRSWANFQAPSQTRMTHSAC